MYFSLAGIVLNTELQQIVQTCYQLFAESSLSQINNVCIPHCLHENDAQALIGTPRCLLPAELLREYCNSAGTVYEYYQQRELEHFLPRILELVAQGEEMHNCGVECTFQHLGPSRADYRRRWSRERQDAIDSFYLALARQTWRGGEDIEPVLCAIAMGGGDIRSILSTWGRNMTDEAVFALAELFHSLSSGLYHRRGKRIKLASAFWAEVPDSHRDCLEWLTCPEHYHVIDKAMEGEVSDGDFAFLLEAKKIAAAVQREQ